MKNLFLSLVLVMIGLVANSQVITVNIHTVQNFNHSSSMSTVQARQLDLIEYPSYTVGENVYTFDLDKKILTFKNSNGNIFSFKIIDITQNENILDCIVFDGIGNVLFMLGENDNGEKEFLTEYINDDKVFGQFSLNSDFDYSVK
jgi:hypothetical protein